LDAAAIDRRIVIAFAFRTGSKAFGIEVAEIDFVSGLAWRPGSSRM